MAHRTLVSCKWLKDALGVATRSDLAVLESSWVPKGKGIESFLEEHIPAARFFDMWEGVQTIPTISRPFPNLSIFEKQLERNGVTDSNHVILYDKGPIMFSARMWLQCKEIGLENVSVLDGGFANWKLQGYPLEKGEAQPIAEGNTTVKRQKKFIDFEEMTKDLQNNNSKQIIDTREPQHFKGEVEEPSTYTQGALKAGGVEPPASMQRGHMLNAKNVFFGELRDTETSCFKSEEELRKLFNSSGVDLNKQTIATCYNGLTACMIPLAASKLGVDPDKFQVYIGSWTEFGQRGPQDFIEMGASKEE